jgi:alpha-tubulin suppressor-like RCC1 family protein
MKKVIFGIITGILALTVLFTGIFYIGNLPGISSTPSSSVPQNFQGSLAVSGGFFDRDSEGNRIVVPGTVPSGDDYIAITGNGIYWLALHANGSIVCWGEDRSGQCNISPENDFIAIAAGDDNSVALRSNGSIACWGKIATGNKTISCIPPPGNDFVAISSVEHQNLALHLNGSLVQWGSNLFSEGEVPSGTDYVAIAAGQFCNLALRSNGTIVCWGSEECCDAPPKDEYVAVSANRWTEHLALTSKGEIVAWDNIIGWKRNVPSGNDFIAVSAGREHNLALRSNGTIACWGPTGGHGECNISTVPDVIAVSACSPMSLAITNPRAKEILAAEWQKTKARIR